MTSLSIDLQPFEFDWSEPIFFICQRLQVPLRFRKEGRPSGGCGGARETYWVTCHNGMTATKTKQSLRYPCFSRPLWLISGLSIESFMYNTVRIFDFQILISLYADCLNIYNSSHKINRMYWRKNKVEEKSSGMKQEIKYKRNTPHRKN